MLRTLITILLMAVPVMAQQPVTATFVSNPVDPEGDPLTLSWSVTPAGPTIDAGQGTNSVDITFVSEGDWQVCLDASDLFSTTQFCLDVLTRVNMPPVIPDIQGPTTIPMPPSGAFLSGPAVIMQATCTDNVGCAKVQFKLDDSFIGPEIVGPQLSDVFEFSWDSTTTPNGTYLIGAVGCDAAGNCQNADPVVKQVQNP